MRIYRKTPKHDGTIMPRHGPLKKKRNLGVLAAGSLAALFLS